MSGTALIVGAGSGLSGSLARLLEAEGVDVIRAARSAEKFTGKFIRCDATDRAQVEAMFEKAGTPDLVVYNPSYRVRGPFTELKVEEVEKTIQVTAMGGFHVAQVAAKRMLPRGSGAIFFTGASASVKGYAQSAPFAMGKFALRGLAQSMARELHPQGIHIGHFVIDGGIGKGEGKLDPDEIAKSYLHLWRQHRSAWAWEIELRPSVEKF
jgi:NAD(P)-dependent dehydrogenase (short-subunit alcohol dehydrogenase family)